MYRSLNCAFASLLLLTGVGPAPAAYASADDAEPLSSPQSTNPGGGGGTANYTYADIVCTTNQVHVVKFKAWGNQYPGATTLDVEQEIDISGHSGFWEKIERWPTTDRNGAWSVATDEKPTLLKGSYTLRVWVYNEKTGKLMGSATDTCKL